MLVTAGASDSYSQLTKYLDIKKEKKNTLFLFQEKYCKHC